MRLPALAKAKVKAKTTQCLSNMKQLELCYNMYTGDNNETLPLNFVNNPTGNWIQGLVQSATTTIGIQTGALYPYNKSVAIYACPANTVTITWTGVNPPPGQYPQTRTCSIEYSMGGNSASLATGPWTLSRGGVTFNSYAKAGQVQRSADKFVFGEEAQSTLNDGEFAMYPIIGGALSPATPTWWNLPSNRHNGGSIWTFLDGHAEYYKWRGAVIAAHQNDTSPNSIGQNEDYQDTAPDDLPRAEAGGAQGQ
jgi:prepilin-type processing-associated H-X9-DG protein